MHQDPQQLPGVAVACLLAERSDKAPREVQRRGSQPGRWLGGWFKSGFDAYGTTYRPA